MPKKKVIGLGVESSSEYGKRVAANDFGMIDAIPLALFPHKADDEAGPE